MTQISERSDEVYNEVRGIPGVMRVWHHARQRMLADFMRLAAPRPGEKILDIGVSDVITDEANFLEQHFPRREDITCVGLGDGAAILAAYPGIAYRRIEAGAPLPFADGQFAIATCNAVLEHVGDDADRRRMLAEMLRVAARVFVTVPNRWFPVEHHTAIPLLHYCPPVFRAFCRAVGKGFWAEPRNLEFLDAARLVRLFPEESRPEAIRTGLLLGPFSSNLACVAGKRPA